MLATLSETFWVLVLAVVVLFAFFVALGAFEPGEVIVLTLVVLGLALLWVGARGLGLAAPRSARPGRRSRARERRGFVARRQLLARRVVRP